MGCGPEAVRDGDAAELVRDDGLKLVGVLDVKRVNVSLGRGLDILKALNPVDGWCVD